MTTTELANEIGNIERQRLRSLVEVRLEDADAFHAPDFELVHPSGGVFRPPQVGLSILLRFMPRRVGRSVGGGLRGWSLV